MRILVDTHVFVWYVQNNERLPKSIVSLINDGRNDILLSVVSVWEMAIKQSTGKLNLGSPYASFIEEQMKLNKMELLPIKLAHTEIVTTLQFYHRDPFDRLLMAQAIAEDIVIVSTDSIFSLYPVQTMWE